MLERRGNSRHQPLSPNGHLTQTSLFQLEYLPVPPALAQHVTTFYHFRCDARDIREIQPASIGQIAIFPHGKGTIHFRNGLSDPSHEVNLLTPFSVAAPFTVDGPFHAIGAALSPLGWAELTRMCAAEHGNRFYPAGAHLGEEIDKLGRQWCAAYRDGTMSGPDCAEAMAQYILGRLKPIKPRDQQLIGHTTAWLMASLAPSIEDLFAGSPFSRRQTQRLVERYFGLSATALRRKYRALRAAAILSQPLVDDELEAAVCNSFYDQPHMIREIRLFAGRTPARLADEPDSYLTEMLDLRNLRELAGPKR